MTNQARRPFRLIAGAVFVVLLAGGGAYSVTRGKPAFDDVAMSATALTSGEALVVDIRTPAEWVETGVVEGALLYTYTEAERFLAQIEGELQDGRDLVLICRSGNRSSRAASELADLIPNRIISVNGGMVRVVSEGYEPIAPES